MFDIAVFVFSVVASTYTFFALCIGISLHAWWHNKPGLALSILCTAVACSLTVLGLKEWLAVPRPPEPLITVDTYAFPSGHATGIAFLATTIWIYYMYSYQKLPHIWITLLLGAIVIAIGLSRILFQVHTVEQVLAGYVLGMVWALLGMFWYRSR